MIQEDREKVDAFIADLILVTRKHNGQLCADHNGELYASIDGNPHWAWLETCQIDSGFVWPVNSNIDTRTGES